MRWWTIHLPAGDQNKTPVAVSRNSKQTRRRRKPAKIQNDDYPARETNVPDESYETLSGERPHPRYLQLGPVITKEMYDQWKPEMFNSRIPRSTRNQNPNYLT